MCVQIPFKEKCIAFWSLNKTFKSEIKENEDIRVDKGKINFSQKEKAFKYTEFNNILKILPKKVKEIKGKSISLVFQTKKFKIKNDDLPNCSLFSLVKDNEVKLCLDFEQNGKCFCINTMEQPMEIKEDAIDSIKMLTHNKWVTHVIIYDFENQQIKYYIDANLTCIIDIVVDMKMSDLYFNRENPCNGFIRNIGVYDCALSYNQIKKLLYHNYYKKFTTTLWLKFIEFLYKNKREMIPWI
jgi:hypothetical protein